MESASPFKYFTLPPLGCDSLQHVWPSIASAVQTDMVIKPASSKVEELAEDGVLENLRDEGEVEHPASEVDLNKKQVQVEVAATSVSKRRITRARVENADKVEIISLEEQDAGNLDYLALDSDEPQLVVKEEGSTPGTRGLSRTPNHRRVHVAEALNREASMPPPWALHLDRFKKGSWFRSPLLQLHKEILEFCDFVSPTEEEHTERIAAVDRVSGAVKTIWPSCQVHVFGSFATGLYLPTSDIDVVILHSGCQVLRDGLKALAKTLTRQSMAKKIQVIANARVPIIKFVEKKSNISFDISFDVANGPQAANFIKAAIEQLPPLKPLCLVLKIFLQQRELNEVYSGGIGSYQLLVMLLTHLQMHPSRWKMGELSGSLEEANLGILLVDFFDLYGRSLNFRDVGVSCRDGGRFFPKSMRGFVDFRKPYLLSVEDPQTPENDIGKNSFAIQKVQSAFALAHQLLTKMDSEMSQVNVGLLGRIVRMDEKLIDRKATNHVEGQSPGNEMVPPYTPGTGQFFSDIESDDLRPPVRKRGRWQDYEEESFPRGDSHGTTGPSGHGSRKKKLAEAELGRKISKKEWSDHISRGHTISNRKQKRAHEGDEEDLERQDKGRNQRTEGNASDRTYPGHATSSSRRRVRRQALGQGRDGRSNHGPQRGGSGADRHLSRPDDGPEASGLDRGSSRFSRFRDDPAREADGGYREHHYRKIITTKPSHKKIKYL